MSHPEHPKKSADFPTIEVLWPVQSFVRLGVLQGRSLALKRGMAMAAADGSPIFSEEAWSDDMPSELKVQDLREGQELSGIVVRVVEELGCFVDVGADKQGLVHATQVARGYTPILSEVVQPGQMVQVWVKAVSPEGRLDLTMVDESQENENLAPFKEVDKDQWLDAQISGLHNGGAFVMVQGPNGEGPVEAHIPISQIQGILRTSRGDVMSQTSGETTESTNVVSTQLATLVPSFDPAKDDLEQFTQKVELLSEIWPASKMNELITRLILNTSGTAFQKLQLNREKLLTNDKSGIQLLVSLLGGQWGKVNLEKKYDVVERALFKCIQRQDESNDSFLARCDVHWSELKSKKIDLDEVHAYILLRGSLLNTEDKKRVILESGGDKDGSLTVERVSKAVRMLGTTFFNDMIGQKRNKGKIYDHQVLVAEDEDETSYDAPTFASEDVTEEEYFEHLLQEADEDAALIADYEAAMAETVQGDEDLAAALCGKKGHWKAECPDRHKGTSSASASGTSTVLTSTAEPLDVSTEPDVLPMEFMQLPLIHEDSLDEPSLHVINVVTTIPNELRERLRMKGNWGYHKGNPKSHVLRNENLRRPHMEISNGIRAFEPEMILLSTHGTNGILDTGATKSVIGSKLLPSFIESLPAEVRKQLCRTKCEITFRFGNQGTLDSQQALVIPLSSIGLGLKVAIVEGETPLLLSNTLIRTLRASINSERQVLSSPLLHSDVRLQLTPKGLYMLDICDLICAQKKSIRRPDLDTAETFVSSDLFNVQKSASEVPPNLMSCERINMPSSPVGPSQNPVICSSSRCQLSPPSSTSAESPRPKPLPPDFIQIAQSLQASQSSQSHEPFQPARSSAFSDISGQHRSLRTEDTRGNGELQNLLREGPCRKILPGDVAERKDMGEVVLSHICHQPEGRTPSGADLHREDGAAARDREWIASSGINRGAPRDCPATLQGTSQSQSISDASVVCQRGWHDGDERGDRRPMGCDGPGVHSVPTGISDPGRDSGLAVQSPLDGGCPDRDSEPDPPQPVRDPIDLVHVAGDIDDDFEAIYSQTTFTNHRQQQFNALVRQFTTELHEVSCQPNIRSEPVIQVMEVLCGPQSELTKQVNQLGFRAVRFGLQEGDVSTKDGRYALFQKLIATRPQHLWYSPTCGPWCSWSQLNESKSEESFLRIQKLRDEHLYQLALGLVLYRHQISGGRHLHWEQPAKSIMLRTPLLKEVIQGTQVAEFDMCRVGLMRDPVNQLLYKKGMEIATTSQQFYQQFHGRKCNHQHEHQQLAGETTFKGMRIRRTEFSERYNRRFARTIAQVLTKVSCVKEAPYGNDCAFAISAKRTSNAKLAPLPKRAKLQNSELIEPQELPVKRRRISGKTTEDVNMSTLCERICSNVAKIAPRVGRKNILIPEILNDLQELFHDKQVVRAIVCKGAERTVMPPKDLTPDEAPFRRAIIVQRTTKNVRVEDQWEEWRFLSNRQLWRRSHPSFLNITVFARNHDVPEQSAADAQIRFREPASASQSRVPDGPILEPGSHVSSVPSVPSASPMPVPSSVSPSDTKSASMIDEVSSSHGPRFMSMSPEDKRLAIRLHKNLGHPDPQRLSKVLQQRGYSTELCQGVLDLKCSICQMQQQPKLQRPATLKEELEFGDKVSIDGVKWVNKQNQEFHFYHFIDHGTNYHTAVIAPNRAEIQERFTAGWLNWAGTPNTVLMDSASEFLSKPFQEYMQSLNIQFTVVPPEAHWQVGRIERHGGVLQNMLSKYELEHDVSSYPQLQQALMHCTMAKNACGLRHGYSPETLVFGRGLRLPGSLVSDDTLPAHAIADSDNRQGIRFRELLAMRETARKAFWAADNDMSLRRAALRRDRPHRGAYILGNGS
eukprot:s1891_g2.t1